jgi:PAS domain S-box-containing protein/putative nucleotidyltransferase with HDIG domain
MNKEILNLLILEDNPADAELAVRELEKEGFVVKWSLVETEEDFREALNQRPDIILADYFLPFFDGLSALKIKQETAPEIPFITITGKIGEELAVEYIRLKVTDYVLKDKLFRLGSVVRRALEEARVCRERKQAEERVKHLNLVLRAIRNVNQLIVREKDREKLLKGACENLIKTRGYHNTWIALLDEEGKLKTCAEAGLGKDFLPMIELLKRGKLTTCSQKALKQQEVVVTENPASTCTECPLAQKCSGRAGFAIRLERNGKVYGLMTVSIPVHNTANKEEQTLFKEVAEDIAFGLRKIELDEERKQAEENMKNIKDELQMILDSVPAIITYKDTESKIIRANKTLANSLKMPVKDIVGKTTEELFPKEQAEKMRKDDKKVIISGKPKRNIIQPYTTPDGIRWLITDKIPYKDKEGKVTGVIGLSKDITVQRKSEEELQQTYQKLKKAMDAAIDTMSNIIEAKDPYTSGHQQRVSLLATAIAKEMGLSEDKVKGIKIASLIHDIGKINIPSEILSKPGKLTEEEFNLIKSHPKIGYDILKLINFSWPVAEIVLQHHERINGSGYPNNLKGDKILLEAKIIGVADVVEAMSSHRPYRPALGIDVALEEISKNKGILYDPEVVDVCLKFFKEKGFKFE